MHDAGCDEVVSLLRGVDTIHAEVRQVITVMQERRGDIQDGHALLITDLIDCEAIHIMVIAYTFLLSAQPREDITFVVVPHVARDEVVEAAIIDERQREQDRLTAQLAYACDEFAVHGSERGELGHGVMVVGRIGCDVRPAEVRIVAPELDEGDVAAGDVVGMLFGNLRATRDGAAHTAIVVEIDIEIVGTLADKTVGKDLVAFAIIDDAFGDRVAQSDDFLERIHNCRFIILQFLNVSIVVFRGYNISNVSMTSKQYINGCGELTGQNSKFIASYMPYLVTEVANSPKNDAKLQQKHEVCKKVGLYGTIFDEIR